MEIIIDSTSVSEFAGQIASTFEALAPLIAMALSVPVLFAVLRNVVMLIRPK